MFHEIKILLLQEGKKIELSPVEFHQMPVTVRLDKLRSKQLRFYRGKDELRPKDAITALAEPVRSRLAAAS